MTTQVNTAHKGALTKYKPGSVREAWQLIYPMILTAMSVSIMLFADRIILAQFSTNAMTAAASAGLVVVTFQFGFMSITGIAETFVGQHNGAKDYRRVGEPVWQMIWFSLATFLICVPLAFYGAEFFVADPYDDLGAPYFRLLMYFSPLMPMIGALSSFFVGLGKPKIVTIVTIIANLINILFDYILVLGIEGHIEPMGTRGAAIATNMALSFEVLVFGYLFLSKQYREKYGTLDIRLKLKPFWDCVRIGTPNAISHMIELSAWAFQLNLMARISDVHITVVAIGQSIFLLFMFVTEGTCRGVGAISANYMGASNYNTIPKMFASALKIHGIMIGIILLIFAFFNKELVGAFMKGDFSPEKLELITYYSRLALISVAIYLTVDGVTWIIIGILTAAGDTKFIMFTNGLTAWIFGILPVYIALTYFDASPALAWSLISLYGFVNAVLFYWRYRSGSWRINRVRT